VGFANKQRTPISIPLSVVKHGLDTASQCATQCQLAAVLQAAAASQYASPSAKPCPRNKGSWEPCLRRNRCTIGKLRSTLVEHCRARLHHAESSGTCCAKVFGTLQHQHDCSAGMQQPPPQAQGNTINLPPGMATHPLQASAARQHVCPPVACPSHVSSTRQEPVSMALMCTCMPLVPTYSPCQRTYMSRASCRNAFSRHTLCICSSGCQA
jgi:hypothetical protein